MLTNLDATFILVFKLISLVIGAIIAYSGINLFKKGVYDSAGDIFAEIGATKLTVQKAAPGTIVTLLGVGIILVSLFKGVNIKSHSKLNEDAEILPIGLSIDSTDFQSLEGNLNVDSIYRLAKVRLKEDNYLSALKYLYFIQGNTYGNENFDSFMKEVNRDIRFSEKTINNIIKEKKSTKYSEEIRSMEINENSSDSIR